MISSGKYPTRSSRFQAELFDGEALLFNQAGSTVIHCNATALIIWELCNGTRSIDDMVQLLGAAYSDNTYNFHKDVSTTLLQLSDLNAIEWK